MNPPKIRERTTNNPTGSSIAKTHLSGLKLTLARITWLVLVIPSLVITTLSFPAYYQQLLKPCMDITTCNIAGATTAKGQHALAALGISVHGYAAFNTIFWATIFAIWCGIGLLIFLRRSDEGMALLTAFFLVMFNTGPTTSV